MLRAVRNERIRIHSRQIRDRATWPWTFKYECEPDGSAISRAHLFSAIQGFARKIIAKHLWELGGTESSIHVKSSHIRVRIGPTRVIVLHVLPGLGLTHCICALLQRFRHKPDPEAFYTVQESFFLKISSAYRLMRFVTTRDRGPSRDTKLT